MINEFKTAYNQIRCILSNGLGVNYQSYIVLLTNVASSILKLSKYPNDPWAKGELTDRMAVVMAKYESLDGVLTAKDFNDLSRHLFAIESLVIEFLSTILTDGVCHAR